MRKLLGFLAAAGALGVGAWATFRKGGGSLSGARRRGGLRGHVEAHELQLFCENDGRLHESQGRYIEKNLERRIAKGQYNHELAKKAWGHLVESCAKKYVKEFGDESGQPWHKMFSTADRREVAKNFADSFKQQYDIDHRTLHGRR